MGKSSKNMVDIFPVRYVNDVNVDQRLVTKTGPSCRARAIFRDPRHVHIVWPTKFPQLLLATKDFFSPRKGPWWKRYTWSCMAYELANSYTWNILGIYLEYTWNMMEICIYIYICFCHVFSADLELVLKDVLGCTKVTHIKWWKYWKNMKNLPVVSPEMSIC